MADLRLDMLALCGWIQDQVCGRRLGGACDARFAEEVCRHTAEHFGLFGRQQEVPRWLTHVVQGIIDDVQNRRHEA